jgi:DNA transformation protein
MDRDGIEELFQPFGAVAVKRMFGGHGVYADGLCFALEIDGEVYLKADAECEAEFAAAGSSPFVYQSQGRATTMSYWRLVAAAYDDGDELRRWAGLGLAAARRAAFVKANKANKAKRAPALAKRRARAASKRR